MSGIFPSIANSSLITKINESAVPFIGTDAGIANSVIIQQLHDMQLLTIIQIVLMIVVIIELYRISRRH
jgi:hypothetical protein